MREVRTVGGGIGLVLILGAFVVHASPEAALYVFEKDLRYGMRGPDVEALQTFLKDDQSIYPEGIVSGWFGPLTRGAVIRFQRLYGIEPAVGFFGPITRARMQTLIIQSAAGGTKKENVQKSTGAIFQSDPVVSPMADPLASAISNPKDGSAGGNGNGSGTSSPEARVKITDPEARHSCAIEPFSRAIARTQSGAYSVALTPSAREKRFTLLTGSLPDGVEAVFRSRGDNPHAVTLTLRVAEYAGRGSFNAVIIYEEAEHSGITLRTFCQMNVMVE